MLVVLVVFAEGKFELHLLAAFVDANHFDNRWLLTFPPDFIDVACIFRNKTIQRLADDLRYAVAEDPLRGAAYRKYPALRVQSNDGVTCGFLDDLVTIL